MSEDTKNKGKYFYATGRRKTAVAKVRVYDAAKEKGITINDKNCEEYFTKNNILIEKVNSPLKLLNFGDRFMISVKVSGGGPNGQAEAIRLGISRALLVIDGNLRKELKAHDYLIRDPRKVERKNPGLKKARRAPQWKKR
jgi:small subunit ribosomal protein S9